MIAKYGTGILYRDLMSAFLANREAVSQLSRRMADYFGVRHAVPFSSARSALECLLRAKGGGGSVALPAYTCIAVPEAVIRAGWHPLLVDIAPGSVNMTCENLEAAILPGTRAVILTHQFGIPPAVRPIIDLCRNRGLFIVEDVAAAIGARYEGRLAGTLGDAAIFSFGLSKVAPAGRVGALLTNDEGLARKAAALQDGSAGWARSIADTALACAWRLAMSPCCYSVLRKGLRILRKDRFYERVAPSSGSSHKNLLPCSAAAAKLAEIQLARLPERLADRRILAQIYRDELHDCEGIDSCSVPASADPAWLQFPVFVNDKERCHRTLLRHGVDLSWTFRYSCGESWKNSRVPNSDRAAQRLLGLPTHNGISPDTARKIAVLLRRTVHG